MDEDNRPTKSPAHTPILQRHVNRRTGRSVGATTPSLMPEAVQLDETSSLLSNTDLFTDERRLGRSYHSIGVLSGSATPRPQRQHSYNTNTRYAKNHSRNNTVNSLQFSQRLINALRAESVHSRGALVNDHEPCTQVNAISPCMSAAHSCAYRRGPTTRFDACG